MEGVRSRIPLLQLPERVLKIVLGQMDNFEKFSLSLVSKRAKSQVLGLNLQAGVFEVYIMNMFMIKVNPLNGNSFAIDLFASEMEQWSQMSTQIELPIPTVVKRVNFIGMMRGNRVETKWRNSYSVKEYLNHLSQIFHSKDAHVTVSTPMNFAPGPIVEAFANMNIEQLYADTEPSFYSIMNLIPKTDSVHLMTDRPFETSPELMQKVLMQNLEYLHTNFTYETSFDNLLLANSCELTVTVDFDERKLNTFFRMWLAGSNPRLKRLHLHLKHEKVLNEKRLLKGINYEVLSEHGEWNEYNMKQGNTTIFFTLDVRDTTDELNFVVTRLE